ncbi:ATP-grasp domain-containing protein [Limosilactobacillus vaginalis]|uniref:Carbamoyl-phosphate synthetase, large subunit, oligomerization domain protein n=2 Tax=Limosilactobacillus vaginalis TaxID=1633 RepID=C2ESR4_9LACO|nr:ATP-grasp domain-containing protein [Limosilactobacillus vaginalis]EEJ41040.1 carbamoyl-phosphate synthetase, large subunit, oligomerization domain protein [Limosilactobacillus vaginalis DSM 5837 = ATCC 49540]KRM48935.1 carbamoyl-phosphate synthase large subunit [Limosilactobacillus vaginalis DSM 5837 = ATCC 49540]MCZ2465718.1 ATP-grasp domain-containing protein [Limosilactobacillus vaginalis]MCZ3746760.1 ATP-grasp domain-containing protein [Limosilactobacillus vaginalis]MCZ3751743.1 ATP-gr
MTNKKSILIIGAGPNNIQHGDEVDSATYQVATYLRRAGVTTILADNNPFSYSLNDSSVIDHSSIGPLTVNHLIELIEKYQPRAILPTLGNRQAFLLTQELLEKGILRKKEIELLGVPEATVRQVNNPVLLERTLRQMGAPMKKIVTVNNYPDALEEAQRLGYPVIIRSVLPKITSTRQIVHDQSELAAAVSKCLSQSRAEQVYVQQSLGGYKEIEVVVQRDQSGTMMMLGMVEDMDPIGIHAGDSIAFNPAQTLLDRQIQDMRDTAFAITRKLRIVGVNHVQFALDPVNDNFYVIKSSPYFDRMVSFVAQSTGYPVAMVSSQLYLGKTLREIDLGPGFAKHAALIEPAMDHIAARVPVWGFSPEQAQKQLLGTEKKSVGTVFGIGRSPAEALFKAIESRYHEPTDFHIQSQAKLSDDELVDRLVHPHAERLFSLLEAMQRGYTAYELVEMTKIDPFYFDQLAKMKELITELVEHPGKEPVLAKAKHNGLSNQLIAKLWKTTPKQIYQMMQDHNLTVKYKEVEPSAGEFDQHTQTFYSAYEDENEALTLPQPSALFIGTGGLRLGLSNAGDFFVASMMMQLHRQKFHTIIMNCNPSSVTLNTLIADKRYIEPASAENVLSVVEIDQPQLIFIPASYTNLLETLKKYDLQSKVITLPDDRLGNLKPRSNQLVALDYLWDGENEKFLASTAALQSATNFDYEMINLQLPAAVNDVELKKMQATAREVVEQQSNPGFYQVIFEQDGLEYKALTVQSISLPEVAFLSKSLGINLPALLGKIVSDQDFNLADTEITQPKGTVTYRATFPFESLRMKPQGILGPNKIIGAEIQFMN